LLVMAAFYGAAFGSFLNVCIYRWGTGQRVTRPASFCPRCHRVLRWSENVPVLGWLWLRGRCRGCRSAISSHYPLMEAGSALLWMAWAVAAPPAGLALIGALLSSLVIAASETAWRYRVGPPPYVFVAAALLSTLHVGLAYGWWSAPGLLVAACDGMGAILLLVPVWGPRLRGALRRA
jgi:leader peptidase (prepilin peptidase)/N-methyltransferase